MKIPKKLTFESLGPEGLLMLAAVMWRPERYGFTVEEAKKLHAALMRGIREEQEAETPIYTMLKDCP